MNPSRQFSSVESLRNRDAFRADERARDLQRAEFLAALDDAEFEVTDWEAKFLSDFLAVASARPLSVATWWTPARRAAVDAMHLKYGGRL